ncbi:MAG TPA: hypothetical protein VGO96_16380 [Pyrinomonadaceae bacterium]|nr:hypothetical protein [Pyrinomonadaceae bacterium]
MRRSLETIIVAALLLCAAEKAARADIKLKIKTTENERSGESVMQIKGRRQRNEFTVRRPDGTTDALAVIFQCDLKRQISFSPGKRVFYEHPHIGIQEFMARAEARSAAQLSRPRPVKYDGRIVETFTVTDTGERKLMFGYTARHIKTTLVWEATPHDCPQTLLRKETDGWYVDLLYPTFCSYDISGFDESELTVHEQSKCVDHYMGDDGKRRYSFERRQVGTARFGFPLLLTVKSYSDEGRPQTRTSEVTEITNEELDASLFEPPAGYTRFTPKKRSLASRALSLFGKG